MSEMIDSWKLAIISMWFERLNREEALKLISDTFTWEDLWEAAAELNQLCASKDMNRKIPRNIDQGDLKDRVKVLGTAMHGSMQELKARTDNPVFVVSSEKLFQVPGIKKDTVQAEPAVTSRLDNIEKMVETLIKGFSEMKASQSKVEQFPALQLNGAAVGSGQGGAQGGAYGGGAQGGAYGGARSRNAPGTTAESRVRSVSPSVKRTAGEAGLEGQQGQQHPGHAGQDVPWNQVVGRNQGRNQGKKPRPVQHGTAKVNVDGGEAAPYDVVVGNTNPGSTKEIIKNVLVQVSENIAEDLKLEEPLEILEVECLTKPRDDGRRVWTKTWRIQVPNKFREHMLRPEAFPAGWTSRKYFPPRAQRPPVPDLHPTGTQPPGKKANLNGQASS